MSVLNNSEVDKPVANGDRNDMHAVGRAEFAHCGPDVLVHRALRNVQDFTDLLGGFSARNPGQNLALTLGQHW